MLTFALFRLFSASLPLFSSCYSSSENLSTISPAGVAELDFSGSDSFHLPDGEFDETSDPLEWLMENDHHLPESSLTAPIFPDFNDVSEGPVQLQPQVQASFPDVMDTLPSLADPKVTVQSLFMMED